MLRRFTTVLILSLLLLAIGAMTAFAAKSPVEAARRATNMYVDKSVVYSFPDERNFQVGVSGTGASLGSFSKEAKATPGLTIGGTWYDYQHNGTIGRMVAIGPHSGELGDAIVHFGWMFLPSGVLADRKYAYTNYNSGTGLVAAVTEIQPGGEYAGYVNVDVTPDNRAVVGGHNDQGSGNQAHIYFDFGAGFSFFSANTRIPNAVARAYDDPDQDDAMIWPKFKYQYGSDTVLHVIASQSDPNDAAGDPSRVAYFRKVGLDGAGTWTASLFVDTNFTLSPDLVAERNGDRVAIVWFANPGTQANPAATGVSDFAVQVENTILYRTSDNQGVTWNATVNLQPETWDITAPGTRPYIDASALFDAAGNLHILWNGRIWEGDEEATGAVFRYNCRLLHWSENVPFIRTVANGDWFTPDCGAGVWNLNISKMQLSECENKLYALWTQFNDAPGGVTDDCALRATSDPEGAANGELFLSISTDGGLTWDAGRNLTNTYTPGCDPGGGGAPCESENWPSMVMYGRANEVGEDWSAATVVDPSGSYADNEFLDVMYINDADAGGIVQEEGSWQLADVAWFRLACVEPVPNPQLTLSFSSISDPAYTKPGTFADTLLTIENTGNVTLTYAIAEVQDNGPVNWLNVTGASGSVPSGLANTETVTVQLDATNQLSEIELVGRLVFTSNAPTSPDTFSINFLVVDTIVFPVVDTIFSELTSAKAANPRLALAVNSLSNYGNQGAGEVNLDWNFSNNDCDTTAEVYLYDGSTVLGTNADDLSWSIFGDGFLDSNGLRPLGGQKACQTTDMNIYRTGTIVTNDSSLAMEKFWFAPRGNSNNDFMIQAVRVWSNDGAAHTILTGEAIDWDIPADTGAYNEGGFNFAQDLIYQVGAEYHQDDTGASPACQDSDARFGGLAFIGGYVNNSGTPYTSDPYSGHVLENDTFVFPASGFKEQELWDNMNVSGLSTIDSTEDLHMIMCFDPARALGAADTIWYYSVVSSVENGILGDLVTNVTAAKSWFTAKAIRSIKDPCQGCCVPPIRGNYDGDLGDAIDIGDLLYMVDYQFGNPAGPAPPCDQEGDGDASGGIDIGDLLYMVDYQFGNPAGPAPLPCP